MEEDKSLNLPPTKLYLPSVVAARLNEIKIMKNSLATSTSTKLAFQKLPIHMRRRNMSYNIKRLPRSLRKIHSSQMNKSGKQMKKHRPNSKYRRRPYNRRNDYMRRQQKHKWLNTHIWHAKRFHMIERWGYKIPDRPCDKAFRACFRATKSHCLVQDISYISCIEIRGNYELIIDKFQYITNTNTGFSIAAKAYLKGNREGNITLFEYDEQIPTKPIGLVYYQWEPTLQQTRSLWLWVHVAFYNEAFETLLKCFDFKLKSLEMNKLYINNVGIELKELRNELNRFRLTGPLSNAILQNCFKMYEDTKNEIENSSELTANWRIINGVTRSTELSPHIILSLIIQDPRLNFPKKRTKALPLSENLVETVYDLPENVPFNPLWTDKRIVFNSNKVPIMEINKMRQKLLVPGSDLNETGAPVPVILIQRPGKRSLDHIGYSGGWDLIFPAKWAQPLWLSLIMWGARSGGLRETNSINFEAGQLETFLPDTNAGVEDETNLTRKYTESFFKKPPNKRTNYNKFRIVSPFECNWKLLIREWVDKPIEKYSVLRNGLVLKSIQTAINSFNLSPLPEISDNFLIPIKLKFEGKGLCTSFAIICLPLKSDYKNVPSEPNQTDPNEKERKEMRRKHKNLLKTLRQRRRRAKANGKTIPIDIEMLKKYRDQMRQLWLPKPTTIRKSCSREVIGFVKSGGFSYLEGKSTGIGYIVSGSINFLLSLQHKNKVLVRNTNSKKL